MCPVSLFVANTFSGSGCDSGSAQIMRRRNCLCVCTRTRRKSKQVVGRERGKQKKVFFSSSSLLPSSLGLLPLLL